MASKQMGSHLLTASIVCFFTLSASFLLMPFEAVGILPGLLFWISLLGAVFCQIRLAARYRWLPTAEKADRKKNRKPRCGLLTFGANRTAKIADIALGCSLVASIIVFWATKGMGYLCNLCLFFTTFTFCMHCVLNGRIYFLLRHTKQRETQKKRRSPGGRRAEGPENLSEKGVD